MKLKTGLRHQLALGYAVFIKVRKINGTLGKKKMEKPHLEQGKI